MKINQTKGKTNGLHKPYFNGSPAQSKATHPIPTPPKPALPKGC